MLVPALMYKEEIEKFFAEHLYDDSMFFYNGYAHCNTIAEIKPMENVYQFAIINSNKEIVGYFSYRIDNLTDTVYNFGLYSFKQNNIIGITVFNELNRLLKIHHRLEWRVIGGNPVKRHYDSFCKKFKGHRVHYHDIVKDCCNQYHDEYVYEILRDKWFTEIDSDEIYERSEPI